MRTSTTYTQIRRIMKLHGDGKSAEDISQTLFIALDSVKHVIDVRFSDKKKPKEAKA